MTNYGPTLQDREYVGTCTLQWVGPMADWVSFRGLHSITTPLREVDRQECYVPPGQNQATSAQRRLQLSEYYDGTCGYPKTTKEEMTSQLSFALPTHLVNKDRSLFWKSRRKHVATTLSNSLTGKSVRSKSLVPFMFQV